MLPYGLKCTGSSGVGREVLHFTAASHVVLLLVWGPYSECGVTERTRVRVWDKASIPSPSGYGVFDVDPRDFGFISVPHPGGLLGFPALWDL